MKRKFIITAFIAFIYAVTFAQNSPGLRTVAFPTPNASGLGKYGEIPVGNYTGIPSISVPIYTVKSHELELPISLSYHAGGIKVEEVASWVGLGFSLNAGGAITRAIRGMPDDVGGYFTTRSQMSALGLKYNSLPNSTTQLAQGIGNGQVDDITTLAQLAASGIDGESDIFYFNFGKYSGKFFMNPSGNFVSIPVQAMKIEYNTGTFTLPGGGITQWILTMEDGVKFVFGSSILDPTQHSIDQNDNGGPSVRPVTAWYLMDVISPNNQSDNIQLTYVTESFTYSTKSSEVKNLLTADNGYNPLPMSDKRITINHFTASRLDQIKYANGTLKFNALTQREDVVGSNRLDEIDVKDNSGTILKKFILDYSYFIASGSCITGSGYCKRLRLDKMTEFSDGSVPLTGQVYQFSYNNTSMPNWDPAGTAINSQDLWGFNNGVPNNQLPQGASLGSYTMNGADRHSDGAQMQAGILTKITYPTGGSTKFDYEANQVYASDNDLGTVTEAPVYKHQFLVLQSGDVNKTLNFSVVNPDPNTGKVAVTIINRQQVYDGTNCPTDPNGFPTCFGTSLTGSNNTNYTLLKETTQTAPINITLFPGDYTIAGWANPSSVPGNTSFYYLDLTWAEFPPASSYSVKSNKDIGGLRIARITNDDGNGIQQIKKFTYQDNLGNSTGALINPPGAYFTMFTYYLRTSTSGGYIVQNAEYIQVQSHSLAPLVSTQGAVLGYANVTQLEGENGENGRTEFTFTTAKDYPDEIQNYRPYASPASFDWRRGLLLSKKIFKNSQSTPSQTTDNTYTFANASSVGYGLAVQLDVFGDIEPIGGNYYVGGYKTATEFFFHDTEKLREYSSTDPSSYVEKITNYEYGIPNGHYQLTKTTTTDSQGKQVVDLFQYPPDISLTGTAETARQALVSKFILNPVLVKTHLINQTQEIKTTSNYMVFANGIVAPSDITQQIGTAPPETRVTFTSYDNFENILEQAKQNDVVNSYIWDYNNEYPIAEVVNSGVADIAYTSFESNGLGNWTIPNYTANTSVARTGKQSYNLTSGAISKTGLATSKQYIISFWAQTGSAPTVNGSAVTPQSSTSINSWQYYQSSVTGSTSVTVSGTGVIDELRLYPSGAQMITHTYSPGIGMISSMDVNNIASYFDYDVLGRLVTIKDDQGNILKSYVYHYQVR